MIAELPYERKVRLGQLASLLGIVALFELVGQVGVFEPLVYVPPSRVASTVADLLVTGELVADITTTLSLVLAAFLLAVAVGIPVGWLLWRIQLLKRVLDPYLIIIYALPLFVFYPMLVVIFGLGRIPIVLIAFSMGVMIITVSTANGFSKVPEVLIKAGRAMNLSRPRLFRHVILPAAVPYIFTGLKLGFVYSFIGVIASEFILSSSGLGYKVSWYYENFLTEEMYATIVFVVVLAVVMNLALIRIEERLHRRV